MVVREFLIAQPRPDLAPARPGEPVRGFLAQPRPLAPDHAAKNSSKAKVKTANPSSRRTLPFRPTASTRSYRGPPTMKKIPSAMMIARTDSTKIPAATLPPPRCPRPRLFAARLTIFGMPIGPRGSSTSW